MLLSASLKAPATLSPVVFAFLRDVVGTAVLLAAAYVYESRRAPAHAAGGVPARRFVPDRADAGHFVLVGVLGVWGTQGLSALAIAELTPAFFSMMAPLYPVVALAFALGLGEAVFLWCAGVWAGRGVHMPTQVW